MPYHVGEKGSYGCSGYPALKDDGTVMGCHKTKEEAANQIYAINVSEGNAPGKGVGIKNPEEWPVDKSDCCPEDSVTKQSPCWDGYVQRGMKEQNGKMVPNCVPVSKAMAEEGYRKFKRKRRSQSAYIFDSSGAVVAGSDGMTTKSDIKEGDFVMGRTSEGIAHGVVEHIMWEGGTLGTPGSEYALESMPPENPAMSVRIYEYEDDEGYWEPTAYSIGMMYQDAEVVDMEDHEMDEMEMISKADSYSPTAGMKAAARRAIKWKEEGKATGAGTPVGWGRARDIVAGRSMSLSVVRRMFSFFSRHEQASKGGKDFNNLSNPSNGRIMWDAWGGDAGFSWSRAIVRREMDKALFANFGKDYTMAEQLTEIFKAITVGSMVSWNSSGGRASGKITRIVRSGSYDVPGTRVTLNASEEDPVAVIRLYRDGEPTDITVAHKLKTLRSL
jgi:hypothetical protein